MSYKEQAERINRDLKDFFGSEHAKKLSDKQKEFIINTILQFGQVAKYRCRNNSAYDNFANTCVKGIGEVKRVKAHENDEWETLRCFIERKLEMTPSFYDEGTHPLNKDLDDENI